jgi:DNA-binding transcriptional regulator LsrR (DeoR family)
MGRTKGTGGTRLDDAARAGWLYYIGRNTQEEIAEKLGISRQAAQRLVSLAVSEGLVRFRLDHPIAHCLDLSARLTDRFGLTVCDVVPSDPTSESTTLGLAEAASATLERALLDPETRIIAIGSGRTLKAAIECLPPIEVPDTKVVSLTGNIAHNGSAALYSAIFTMADRVKAEHYLMPAPVVASSVAERDSLHQQSIIQRSFTLAKQANVVFVGLGDLGPQAPLLVDGFIDEGELDALRKAGAVGEILGWAFDAEGELVDAATNRRVASVPLEWGPETLVTVLAMGRRKLPGMRAVLRKGWVRGLVTDEWTAEALLKN